VHQTIGRHVPSKSAGGRQVSSHKGGAVLKTLGIPALLMIAIPSVAVAQTSLAAGDSSFRMAYFSPQRAFALSADGKAAEARLAALEAETTREVGARTAKLNQLRAFIRQNEAVLNESARQQRELEAQRFEIDIKRFVEDAQAEFMGVQRNLENAFLAKLRPAVATVVKERGVLLLFDEDSGLLAWADPTLDITSDIARRVSQP
jgi:Skp family chaperone for outer membrane proteins